MSEPVTDVTMFCQTCACMCIYTNVEKKIFQADRKMWKISSSENMNKNNYIKYE